MTEDDARRWIDTQFGSVAVEAMAHFVTLIRDEAPRQNLISASSMQSIWVRHIVDSAQLVPLTTTPGTWIDVGTGAGFPGIVTALLSGRETILIEPRRRRVEFLEHAIAELGLGSRASVIQSKAETCMDSAATISARAVSSIDALFTAAIQCSTRRTQWLLPKGRSAREEVAQAKKSWHGMFHVEQSITDPESMIVVASGVSRR